MVGDRVRHCHRSPLWSAVGELVIVDRDDGRQGEFIFKTPSSMTIQARVREFTLAIWATLL